MPLSLSSSGHFVLGQPQSLKEMDQGGVVEHFLFHVPGCRPTVLESFNQHSIESPRVLSC
jgi:hypothetical protein